MIPYSAARLGFTHTSKRNRMPYLQTHTPSKLANTIHTRKYEGGFLEGGRCESTIGTNYSYPHLPDEILCNMSSVKIEERKRMEVPPAPGGLLRIIPSDVFGCSSSDGYGLDAGCGCLGKRLGSYQGARLGRVD